MVRVSKGRALTEGKRPQKPLIRVAWEGMTQLNSSTSVRTDPTPYLDAPSGPRLARPYLVGAGRPDSQSALRPMPEAQARRKPPFQEISHCLSESWIFDVYTSPKSQPKLTWEEKRGLMWSLQLNQLCNSAASFAFQIPGCSPPQKKMELGPDQPSNLQ